MRMRARSLPRLTCLSAAVMISGCGDVPSQQKQASERPRFDPARVEAMKSQLRAEPKILGLEFHGADPDGIEWSIMLRRDDSPSENVTYARYVCSVLRKGHLSDNQTEVAIYNAIAASADHGAPGDVVRCRDDHEVKPVLDVTAGGYFPSEVQTLPRPYRARGDAAQPGR